MKLFLQLFVGITLLALGAGCLGLGGHQLRGGRGRFGFVRWLRGVGGSFC